MTAYTDIDEGHRDILGEISNIGAGNAAVSLSRLLDDEVFISVPSVHIDDYHTVIDFLRDPEERGMAVLIGFSGDIEGLLLFLMSFADAKKIVDRLVGYELQQEEALSEMGISAIKEVGNIVGSSYLNSISKLTGFRIDVAVPFAKVDMMGALLADTMIGFSADGRKLFLVEEKFHVGSEILDGRVILFADMPSLMKLAQHLDIGKEL